MAGTLVAPLIATAPRAEAEGISPELERIAAEVVAADDHVGDWLWAEDEVKQREIGRYPTDADMEAVEAAWARRHDAVEALHSFEPSNIKELSRKALAMRQDGICEWEEGFRVLCEDLARLAGTV